MKINNITTAIAVSLIIEGCTAYENNLRGLRSRSSARASVASDRGGASRGDAVDRTGEEETDELTLSFTQNAVATIMSNLSAAQLEEALVSFDELDKNGDDILQFSEVFQSDELKPLLRDHDNWKDSNKDEQSGLTFEEFLEWLVRSDAFAAPPVIPQYFVNKLIVSSQYSEGMKTILDAFRGIDADSNGIITTAELDVSFPASAGQPEYLFDATIDGALQLESYFMAEMQNAYPNSLFGDNDEKLDEFKALDANENGYLDYEDLSDLLPVREMDDMVRAYDYNGDGQIGYSEYFIGTTPL